MPHPLRPLIAHALLALSLAQLVIALVPWPLFALWMLRYAAREALLLAALFALCALVLAPSLTVRAVSLVALVLSLAPALACIPLYRRAGVPFSFAQYLTGYTGPRVPVRRDVAFVAERPDLLVDVYAATTGPAPHPFAVVVHGGSWQHGDKGELAHVSHALARAGVTVFDVRYRLAPAHRFPAPVSDVKCVFARVTSLASSLGIDPSRGTVIGRSAGGQIALVSAYAMDDPEIASACENPTFRSRAVASVYAPTDLAYGYYRPIRPDVVHGPESLELYLGGAPDAVPAAYRAATPQTYADRVLPQTLLVHGTGDAFVRTEHALRLADALAAHGQASDVWLVPFAEHGFDVRPGGVGEQLTRALIVRLATSQ